MGKGVEEKTKFLALMAQFERKVYREKWIEHPLLTQGAICCESVINRRIALGTTCPLVFEKHLLIILTHAAGGLPGPFGNPAPLRHTRLQFFHNQVRLQLFALAYNLGSVRT